MTEYYAVFQQDPGRPEWGVVFPDFPGCVTVGDTLEEARANAKEALELHIEGMIKDGDALPEPSSYMTVHADHAGSVIQPVTAPGIANPTVRISITAGERDLAAIRAAAKKKGTSLSAFLVESALRRSGSTGVAVLERAAAGKKAKPAKASRRASTPAPARHK